MSDDGVISINCAFPGCDKHYVGLYGTNDCVPFCDNPKHKEWAYREMKRREHARQLKEAQ